VTGVGAQQRPARDSGRHASNQRSSTSNSTQRKPAVAAVGSHRGPDGDPRKGPNGRNLGGRVHPSERQPGTAYSRVVSTADNASSGPDPSRIRVGDAERNSAIDALGEHLSTGRIDLDEYGERSAQVTQARTVADLRGLFTDLPPPHPKLPDTLPVLPPPSATASRYSSPPSGHGEGRTPAQRAAAVAIAVSGILSLLLFFVLKIWVVFLIPGLIAVATSAVWGRGWNDGSRRR